MDITNSKLIFITGASRSGTTLLSLMLRNHSEIRGLKELQYFGEFWDPRDKSKLLTKRKAEIAVATMFARQSQGILVAKATQSDVMRAKTLINELGDAATDPATVFASTVREICAGSEKSIPCEQTPRNIYYASAILDTYPDAYVIHMMRDPRGVMASQKWRWMRRRLVKDQSNFPWIQSIRVWTNYHPYIVTRLWSRAAREAIHLDGHERFSVLKFEDLLVKPEDEMRNLCSRLKLRFEPAMLKVGQVNSSHRASVEGARDGMNKESIEAWKTRLSAEEIDVAENHCETLMKLFGYRAFRKNQLMVSSNMRLRFTLFLHLLGGLVINPRRVWIQFKGLSARYMPIHEYRRRN